MATVRLPIITTENINQFAAGVTAAASDYIQNGVILQYGDGKYYVTQRPSFETFNQTASANNRGRGVFFWDDDSTLYIVDGTQVFLGDYSSELTPDVTYGTAIANGTERVYIAELNGSLFLFNPEGNEGKYVPSTASTTYFDMDANPNSPFVAADISFTAPNVITTAGVVNFSTLQTGDKITVSGSTGGTNDGTYEIASTTATTINLVEQTITTQGAGPLITITDITFSTFPPNNGLTLAHGIAVLDKTMYALATNGQIWGSELNDGTTWFDGLNFVTAEKEDDDKNYIDVHHDHIVVFSERTIEFFYNAGNEVGSPLSARNDLSYNIGCADPKSVWRNGDEIYFLGIDTSGEIAAYVLRAFEIQKISSTTVTSFYTNSRATGGYFNMGSGVSAGNNGYYIVTNYFLDGSGNIVPTQSNVFNTLTKTWTRWIHSDPTINQFPLISWTITDTTRIGQGILSSGEIVSLWDNFVPQDGEAAARYILTDYIGAGYYIEAVPTAVPIEMKIRINSFDGDTRNWKFCRQLRYVGDTTSNPQNLTVSWSNENDNSYNAGRIIDISKATNKLTGLGRFKSRGHELTYQGSEQIRMEGIELEVDVGSH